MRARVQRMMAAALVMALAACGPSETSSPGRGNARLLTEDELGRASVNNVFDAVQRLRPAWLMPRYAAGTRGYPTIYVGSQRYGDVETLRTLETANVLEVHYFDAVDASSRFGRNVPFGVIQVILDVGG
ncbi:MAG TPA: hypothetical protein VFR37_04700 [Longimicrobium sp.]|nr:hypothetical protein [Longimicrobium sp.]